MMKELQMVVSSDDERMDVGTISRCVRKGSVN